MEPEVGQWIGAPKKRWSVRLVGCLLDARAVVVYAPALVSRNKIPLLEFEIASKAASTKLPVDHD